MRARDLKKLTPGQPLKTKLTKLTLCMFPWLKPWHDRVLYFDHLVTNGANLRSSKKCKNSTTSISLFPKEFHPVN